MPKQTARTSPLGPLLLAIVLAAGCSSSTSDSPSSTSQLGSQLGSTTSTTSSTTTAVTNCLSSDLATTVAYTTIADVAQDLTSLDIYTPASAECNAPVVMWVHGGGYAVGDKRNQIGPKAQLFNDAGWILVSVNYRLTNPRLNSYAQYPDHYNDVATAVAWVHDNIAEYGGDPTRIALLGHSAGADIVSNVAVNPVYLQDVGLELAALSCAGPLDTEGFDKEQAASNDPDGERAQWRDALGNNPNYVAQTSATRLIKPAIGIPPMIGVVRGSAQRQQIETEFLAGLVAAGIEAVSIDARSLTHSEVNNRIGAANDQVMTPALMEFLTSCLN